jgi:hypothetical protein
MVSMESVKHLTVNTIVKELPDQSVVPLILHGFSKVCVWRAVWARTALRLKV